MASPDRRRIASRRVWRGRVAGRRVWLVRVAGRGAAALRAGSLAVAAWLLAAATALAETPSPTGAAVGDPRSSGSGPGLVGDPLFAIGIVVLIAVISLAATLAYVRATGGRRSAER